MVKKVVILTDLDAAREVEERLLEQVQACGYDEPAMFAVKLALEEALNNAIKHGNAHDPSKTVTVEYEVTHDQIKVCISDQGPGFKLNCVPDPLADENLEKPSGRGVMLMKAYMDEVFFNKCGNQVCLIKRKS